MTSSPLTNIPPIGTFPPITITLIERFECNGKSIERTASAEVRGPSEAADQFAETLWQMLRKAAPIPQFTGTRAAQGPPPK